jgi:hypothetical protein
MQASAATRPVAAQGHLSRPFELVSSKTNLPASLAYEGAMAEPDNHSGSETSSLPRSSSAGSGASSRTSGRPAMTTWWCGNCGHHNPHDPDPNQEDPDAWLPGTICDRVFDDGTFCQHRFCLVQVPDLTHRNRNRNPPPMRDHSELPTQGQWLFV